MTPERWERIGALFHAALEVPEADRRDFLHSRCGDDLEMRAEVEALLAAEPGAAAHLERLAGQARGLAAAILPGAFASGAVVSHYTIEEPIGSGGMGVVYRARDLRLDRTVALKFLPPHLGRAAHAERRFTSEARAAAALEHPNICAVYEIDETDDGRPFIAMAFVAGESLRARLARGPLPLPRALDIAIRIAEALTCAHGHGIVHRDVKPANVMLRPDGGVTLLDFGVAKLAGAALTNPGATPGTAAYMSPEQARGDPVDHRTDLWALGVVLYESLTGRRPFIGDSPAAVAHAITRTSPPSLRTVRADIPAAVDRVVLRALARRPAKRYQTAPEFETALRRVTDAPVPPHASAPPARRLPAGLFYGVPAVLLVAALGVLGWHALERSGAPATPPAAPSIAVLPFVDAGGDSTDRYFSDGLSEDLIIALSRAPGLRVIGRESSFRFRGTDRDSRAIGHTLGVTYLLEGSVSRVREQVRLRAELVNAADGSTLWSQSYDRPYRNLFALEDDLTSVVARALRATLLTGTAGTPVQSDRPPSGSLAAYTAYLQGNFESARFTKAGDLRAIAAYRRAIALDGRYAAAYARLSSSWTILGEAFFVRGADLRRAYENARAAVDRALALDSSLAMAHHALAFLLENDTRDWRGAEAEDRKALALAPTDRTAQSGLALSLAALGRPVEAVRLERQVVASDPLNTFGHFNLGRYLIGLGRYDEARTELRQAIQLHPRASLFRVTLTVVDVMRGDTAAALRAAAAEPVAPGRRFALALADAATGDSARADAALRTLIAMDAGRLAYAIAQVYALRRDPDRAFAWLDRARRQHEPGFATLLQSPFFRPYYDDPRFAAICHQVGLPAPSSGAS